MSSSPDSPSFTPIPSASILAVLVLERLEDALPVANALLAGGINLMELTLRTPIALGAIRQITTHLPKMKVGAGTLLTADQVRAAKQAGAAFGVSPGVNPRTVAAARSVGLPFAPGICTPTDIEISLENGCSVMKFFPSEVSGGLPYLQQIAAPYVHLGVKFIPLGGINASNASTYLKHPVVHAIGGSWLAPADLISQQDWSAITELARKAREISEEARSTV